MTNESPAGMAGGATSQIPPPPPLGLPSSGEPMPLRAAIESAVTAVFGVQSEQLGRSTRGRAPIALARQVAMYLAHVGCGLTLTQVGQLFQRDRTTVGHACMVIEDRRDDPIFDRVLDLLERIIRQIASPRPVDEPALN